MLLPAKSNPVIWRDGEPEKGFPIRQFSLPCRMSRDRLPSRLLQAPALCLSMVGSIVLSGAAQEADKTSGPAKFDTIEGNFFQIQDAFGYFWQTAENGALTSGETQYLQSGLNLVVDGTPFAPVSGEMVAPAVDSGSDITLTLREKRGSLALERALWFDPARGGVRIVDSISNVSKAAITAKIELRTTFPFGWQSLHSESGEALSKDPVLQLGAGNHGLLIHFSSAEGRHDTFVLCGAGGSANQAKIEASTNRRELTLHYELVIAPGETVSLLHWILQAGLPEVGAVADLAEMLIRRGELVTPNIDRSKAVAVANFSSGAFPQPQSSPTRLRELLSLNEMLDRLGAQRRGKDTLWLNSATSVNGEISGADSVEIDDIYLGLVSVPVDAIAAISGTGSPLTRIFLRDGRVHVGTVTSLGLSFAAEGAEAAKELSVSEFNMLLFRISEKDGVPPAKTLGFVESVDGAVFAVTESDEIELSWRSVFGAESSKGSEISEIRHFSLPVPQFRIVTKSGDRLSAFLNGGPLLLKSSEGDPIEIPYAYLAAYREVGLRGWTVEPDEGVWIGFEEIAKNWVPESGFLFSGNCVRSGGLADESILWLQETGTISVATEQIKAISREPAPGKLIFNLTLQSGEVLPGRPAQTFLNVDIGGETRRQIPIEKIYAYRAE